MGRAKIIFGDQVLQDLTQDTVTPEVLMEGYTAHAANGDRIVGTAIGGIQEKLLKDTVGWTGKNLLPNMATSRSVNEVEFTVNADGSVTANGTATANTYYPIYKFADLGIWGPKLAGLKVIGSGCTGGSASTYRMFFQGLIADDGVGFSLFDGDTEPFTIDSNVTSHTIITQVIIQIQSGVTVNNVTFYPMLRLASNPDSTYEPYHEDVVDVLRDAEVVEGKNLFSGIIEQGGINGSGLNAYNTIRIRGKDYYEVDENTDYIISLTNNVSGKSLKCIVHYYTVADYSTHSTSYSGWITDFSEPISFPTGTKYVRFHFGFTDDTEITPSNVSDPMLCTQAEWTRSHAYEPYYVPVKDAMFRREEQRVLGVWNLFNNTAVSQTVANVPITVNADKTMLLNGTATGNIRLNLGSVTLKPGTYYLSGGANSDFYLNILNTAINSTDYNGTEFTVTEETTYSIMLVENGTKTANNLVVKPMISLEPNQPYVHYAMTNRELTDNVTPIDLSTLYTAKTNVTFNSFSAIKIGNIIVVSFSAKIGETVSAGSWKELCNINFGFKVKDCISTGINRQTGNSVVIAVDGTANVIKYVCPSASTSIGNDIYSGNAIIVVDK